MNHLVLLIVDGVPAGLLGPYGNTWIETPAWNRLATQSQLYEHVLLDDVQGRENLVSLLTGTHGLCRRRNVAPADRPWWGLPGETEYASVLITDCEELAQSSLTHWFDEVEFVESLERTELSEHADDTQTANFFAALSAHLSRLSEPTFTVAYCRGLYGPWDAPYEWRQVFVAEEDPEPPTWLEPPRPVLLSELDPDDWLGIRAAAGAQIMLLDTCLDALLDQLQELNRHQHLPLVITSTRGFALGEHGSVGDTDENLHAEATHVPCFLWDARLQPLSYRRSGLLQMADVAAELAELSGVRHGELSCGRRVRRATSPITQPLGRVPERATVGVSESAPHQLAITQGPLGWRWQTAAWCAIHSTASDAEGAAEWSEDEERGAAWQLFVKPDDRWELNDVADRCPEVVEAFAALERQLASSWDCCWHDQSLPIPGILTEPVV